jgi:SAM-dependent MidA family methyltransferase
MNLREYIETEIRSQGPIPFSRFMQLCLYGEPGSPPGYYTRDREQFGKAGDFYTSSDVHAVYGRLLCRQFDQMWRTLGQPSAVGLVEIGPGRGLFAADVLAWADKKFPAFALAVQYHCVETSLSLRERLRERFESEPRIRIHVSLGSAFEAAPANAIVFANEFFDALPTEILDHRGEVWIALEGDKFVEQFVSPSRAVTDFAQQYAILPQDGERIEAPLVAQDYMLHIAELMKAKRGFCVFVDYGYVRDELLAGRHLGTVTSFRKHTISDSPYDSQGEQDITVHVNFTALAAAAREHGLEPLGWVTQSQFLIGIGEESQFAEAFEECKLPQEHAKRALQLKHLITPEGMGEAFHVLVLASNVEQSAQLDGLKFMRPSNAI